MTADDYPAAHVALFLDSFRRDPDALAPIIFAEPSGLRDHATLTLFYLLGVANVIAMHSALDGARTKFTLAGSRTTYTLDVPQHLMTIQGHAERVAAALLAKPVDPAVLKKVMEAAVNQLCLYLQQGLVEELTRLPSTAHFLMPTKALLDEIWVAAINDVTTL